ncbi:sodium- and chloride-dependent glycine transporter 1 [Cylas formicarius]|uniref:sodium- and chloride-dependent glycine transporter 1 n=1 Tax=Cylas formicarius TaxID=197179 RepID=UPI002958A005|nr:sodium- and chloride-dependent glycine transporter 1 [Cylas formicarius]
MKESEEINGIKNESQKQNADREQWANKTEYILSALGYCIGIGNVWRFPYLCYRSGGGAFLVPYLIMLFFCGVPLFFMESSLGQFSNTGCITIFRISPLFKGAGIAVVVVNLVVTTYFVTLYSYPLLFLFYSFNSTLPWTECNNRWNTEACVKLHARNEDESIVSPNSSVVITMLKTSADEFFNNEVLHVSESIDELGSVVWPLFGCNLLGWIATYLCLSRGIKSVGKAVYFSATFPFVILFVLLVRGVTLPGAWDGIYFYIYPQWDQLTNFKIWCDAAVQIFFSLGPGWGGIVNMASYNNFNNNNKADSILIALCNSGTSIFAGFVVFSIIGFMSHQTGLPLSSVATGGPGLVYVTYPEAISMLPWPNLWAILFFLMLFFLGLDSAFVSIEAIVTSITDAYPKLRVHKNRIILLSSAVLWLFSTIYTTNSGIYWLTIMDYYSASISVVLICFVEVIIVGWIYGVRNFASDIEFMINDKISWFWRISWKITAPLILGVMFVILLQYNTRASYNAREFPQWAIDIGWISCLSSIVWIPAYMGYHLLYNESGDLFDRIKASVTPRHDWGPAKEEDRIRWYLKVKRKSIVKHLEEPADAVHQEFVQLCTL